MIDEGYLEYLNGIYQDVTHWLNAKDHVADSTKREFFCKMIATPYYYWKQKDATTSEDTNFDREGFLNGLKKKYKMIPTKTGLKLPGYLNDRGEFRHLADNMRLCGYEYNKEDQEFQLMEVPNHV